LVLSEKAPVSEVIIMAGERPPSTVREALVNSLVAMVRSGGIEVRIIHGPDVHQS
jgi:hypothetical protein